MIIVLDIPDAEFQRQRQYYEPYMKKLDIESYWEKHGIHTAPCITCLAFKECSQKAVSGVIGKKVL